MKNQVRDSVLNWIGLKMKEPLSKEQENLMILYLRAQKGWPIFLIAKILGLSKTVVFNRFKQIEKELDLLLSKLMEV